MPNSSEPKELFPILQNQKSNFADFRLRVMTADAVEEVDQETGPKDGSVSAPESVDFTEQKEAAVPEPVPVTPVPTSLPEPIPETPTATETQETFVPTPPPFQPTTLIIPSKSEKHVPTLAERVKSQEQEKSPDNSSQISS